MNAKAIWMRLAAGARVGARRHGHWLLAGAAILAVTAWLMRAWLTPYLLPARYPDGALPTSSRQEVLTEMAIVWMFQQELALGHMLTEWNPYWFSGFPWLRFLAYPLYYGVAATSAALRLSLDQTLVGFYAFVMAGSGLAMYLYLQRVLRSPRSGRTRAGRLAALIGALAYEAFPYHNHVGVETWIHAAFWVVLPVALWAIEWACEPGLACDPQLACAPRVATAGAAQTPAPPLTAAPMTRMFVVAMALALFPITSTEYALIAGPLVALYLALRMVIEIRASIRSGAPAWRCWLGGLARWAAAGVMALGLAAFLLLPGLLETDLVGIHAKHALGTTFTDELLRDYAVTPKLVWYAIGLRLRLPAALRPALGDPGLPALVHSFWSIAWYPGLFAGLLSLLGLGALRRNLTAVLAAVGLFLSLIFVTGPTAGLSLFSRLPVIGRLSAFRGMLLVVTFGCTLAAFGAEWLLSEGPAVARRLIARTAQGGAPHGYARALWEWGAAAALAALILLDFAPSAGAYQTTPAYLSAGETDALAWLDHQSGAGRLWEPAELPRDRYMRTVSLTQTPRLRYTGYYDNGAPLHTWQQAAWTDTRTVLHLHQVRYVLLHDADAITMRIVPELRRAGYVVVHDAGDVAVWENPDNGAYARWYTRSAVDLAGDIFFSFRALPQLVWSQIAMVAGESLPDSALDRTDVAALPFDYFLTDQPAIQRGARQVILPRDLGARLVARAAVGQLPPAPPADAWVWAERVRWDEIHVEADVSERGVLTLAESWYPHWRVQVDGEPRTALRVNWALLGVQLEPGMHRITFQFQRPWYVYAGFLISLITLGGIVLWWTRYLSARLRLPRPLLEPSEARALMRGAVDEQ
ncbi:MAG: hypothetical protein V1772_02820 [Chloroflexota bacterium]